VGKTLPVVKFNPTAGGTTDWTYSSAITGYQSPALAGAIDGQFQRYRAESLDLTQWENGYGLVSGGGTVIARTIITENSSGTGTRQGGAGTKINFSATPIVGIVFMPEDFRERLDAARTIYVGVSVGAPTISIATPAVVSLTAHGLSAGDRVVFNVPRNTRSATITSANPGVVTLNNHGLVANRPVIFHSTKLLPAGLAPNTTYYVVGASITTNTFRVSATSGGAAINTTALTTTFAASTTITTSAAHNLKVGQIVQFAGTVGSGFSVATDYWVTAIGSSTTFSASATPTGSAISSSVATGGTLSSTGSHYCSTVGALPTGVTEGTTYFVQTAGLTANAFRISTSFGGADINTSGTVTGSPVYNVWTGNDANNGMTATRSGALFTVAAATAIAQTYDIGNNACTVSICQGYHADTITISNPFLVGTGSIAYQGNSANSPLASNYIIAGGMILNHPALFVNVSGLRFLGSVGGFQGTLFVGGMLDFGMSSGQVLSVQGVPGFANVQTPCIFTGAGGLCYQLASLGGTIWHNVSSSFLDVPAFTQWFSYADSNGLIQAQAAQNGSCTVASNSWNTNTGGGIYSQAVAGALLGNIAGVTTSPGWKT